MSTVPAKTGKRVSVIDVRGRKNGTPLVVLTAYTAPMARLIDPHVDVILVGDSLGMVIYGMDNTLPVTLDMMIAHGRAVVQSSKRALVVVDMPFGSYQASPGQAFLAASRVLVETGAAAVKLEGGREMADTIRFLADRGVPVMAHVGLMPQRVNAMGGYRYQGRNENEATQILQDAVAVQQAGAFSVVMEGVQEDVARDITGKLTIPTIGIGASVACDGQVLVVDDMLGLSAHTPSFVKSYADLAGTIEKAVAAYSDEVRARSFPDVSYTFPFKKK